MKHLKPSSSIKELLQEYSWLIALGLVFLPLLAYFSTLWKIIIVASYLVLLAGYKPGPIEPYDPSTEEEWKEEDEWTV